MGVPSVSAVVDGIVAGIVVDRVVVGSVVVLVDGVALVTVDCGTVVIIAGELSVG